MLDSKNSQNAINKKIDEILSDLPNQLKDILREQNLDQHIDVDKIFKEEMNKFHKNLDQSGKLFESRIY